MPELFVEKERTPLGWRFKPAHSTDRDILKALPATPLRVTVHRVRNYLFHRKYFALLNFAFECWEPVAAEVFTTPPEKNFERFRKDIAILAGFYRAHFRLNGDVMLEAKSIAFHSMSEDEFAELYDKTINVIVQHVLTNYNGEELRDVIEKCMAFES